MSVKMVNSMSKYASFVEWCWTDDGGLEVVRKIEHEYDGEWELAKYDDSKKAADAQLAKNNAAASAAQASQGQFTGDVRNALKMYLSQNGVGFTPEQRALLESQFRNQNSQYFNNAGQNVRASLAGRGVGGGDQPIGGNYVRGIAGLEGLKGATTAAGLQDIRLQDLQQALSNKFNTANLFAGIGGQYGQQALGYGGLANENVNQIHQAFRKGIFEQFGDSFANSLGSGLGTVLTGGTGGLGQLLQGGQFRSLAGGANGPTANAARGGMF